MEEVKSINPVLLEICVKAENLTPRQKNEIHYGTIYRHGGFIQFRRGADIYITRDNEIVRNYLKRLNFESAEYGSAPVEHITSEDVDRKFNELHAKKFGRTPHTDWGKTNETAELSLLSEYRKYAALCCDENLWQQNISPEYTDGSLYSLKSFIYSLKQTDPYFKSKMDDFKDTPSGKSFAMMLRDKKLKGKELEVLETIDDILEDTSDDKKAKKTMQGWVKEYLGEKHLEILNKRLTISGLDRETIDHYSSLIASRVAELDLKKEEGKQGK